MTAERGKLSKVLQHPDIHTPWSQWSEDQLLHLVVPYSNPWRWQSRRVLMNDCIRHFRHSPNVRLYVIECAFGSRPHEFTQEQVGPGVTLIQVRTQDEIWVKECMVNLAVRHFPIDWQNAGYCDGDFHFTRHDWALEAIHLLQHYDFVQLFSTYGDLTGETPTSWEGHRPYRINSSFAWNFQHPKEFLQSRRDRGEDPSSYLGQMVSAGGASFPFGFWPGAPGGAWAWRRSAFETVGGLLDTCILGSGDYHMAVGLAGLPDTHREMMLGLPGYTRAIQDWQSRAAKLADNIGCVDNFAVHHWHGNKKSRGYGDRPEILRKHSFDPFSDIHRDWQGLWKWDGRKPALRDAARKFFLDRNEDEHELRDVKRPLA